MASLIKKKNNIIKGLVSVIIPVYNRPKMLQEAVDSVLQQTYRPLEIIVVDDGSTDETVTIAQQLAQRHDEVKVCRQENAGPGFARETGRQLAQGEFIQYLDSDDLLLPDKLSLQVAALRAAPEAGLCYGKEVQISHGQALDLDALQPIKQTGRVIKTVFPELLYGSLWGTSVPLWTRVLSDTMPPWTGLCNEEDLVYDAEAGALQAQLAYVSEYVAVQRIHDTHLSSGGTVDERKLKDRALARGKIFEAALQAGLQAGDEPLVFYARTVFHLARQCAAQGLRRQSEELLRLAEICAGGSWLKLRLYKGLLSFFGVNSVNRVAAAWENIRALFHNK